MTKNSIRLTQEPNIEHHVIVISGTHVQNDYISITFFSFFQNSDFLGFQGG